MKVYRCSHCGKNFTVDEYTPSQCPNCHVYLKYSGTPYVPTEPDYEAPKPVKQPKEYKSDPAESPVADNIEITGEGDTIEEAREKAKSKLPKDYGQYALTEAIINDGKPQTKRYTADTIVEAYKKAEKELDKNVTIIEKKEVQQPEKRVISLTSITEDGLLDQAKSQINDNKFTFIKKTVKVLIESPLSENIEITGEGETIEEAREKAKSKVSKDYGQYTWMEAIIHEGKPVTKRYTADTIVEAYKEAEKELPKNAKIIEKREIQQPEKRVINLTSITEDGLLTQAKPQINDKRFIFIKKTVKVPSESPLSENIEITGEGETLEEARKKAKRKLPKGYGQYTWMEAIIPEGKPVTKRYTADTIVEAYKEADKELPNNAKIIEKREIQQPEKRVINLTSITEDGLLTQAKTQINDERFIFIKKTVKVPYKKGFLGIGKVIGQYEFEFLRPAEIEVTYRQNVVVSIFPYKKEFLGKGKVMGQYDFEFFKSAKIEVTYRQNAVVSIFPYKKEFLEKGKVMGEYEFEFFRPAEVEVTYNQKAAVSISLFKTVKINNQLWMPRNLDVDHYSNGDPIPEVKDEKEWSKLKTGAWCYYENEAKNGMKYGKLYNWYAVNDKRGLAPKGWHIPTIGEFETLIASVNENSNALKSIGQGFGGGAGTNTSGFSALLSGFRYGNGSFYGLGDYAIFWSSSETTTPYAYYMSLGPGGSNLLLDYYYKGFGFSVRCVQD